MRHGSGTDPLGHFHHRDRLLGPLGRDAQGVDLAPEDVPLDQVADEPVEHGFPGINLMVLDRADREGLLPDLGEFGGVGPAGVHMDGVDSIAPLGEPGDTVTGVEAAREGERDCRFMHNA